jgi:hypothetical protein
MRPVGEKASPDSEVPTMNTATELAPETSSTTVERPAKSLSTHVRCFVYSVGDKCYRAECIDLDIAAEGSTEREARRGLRDAMFGYLSVVCEEEEQSLRVADEKTFRKIILRPAPVTHRIHYYIGKVHQAAFPKDQNHRKDRFYTLPAPCSGL